MIAGSFAEIFHGNCTTLGIPCVVMDQESRAKLAGDVESNPDAELIIDLEAMQVVFANSIYSISMKESTREAFLASTYDPLDNLLSASDEIKQTAVKLGYA